AALRVHENHCVVRDEAARLHVGLQEILEVRPRLVAQSEPERVHAEEVCDAGVAADNSLVARIEPTPEIRALPFRTAKLRVLRRDRGIEFAAREQSLERANVVDVILP